MKNMKKLVALLLAMCIATSLVGCGSQKSETPDNVGEVRCLLPIQSLTIKLLLMRWPS